MSRITIEIPTPLHRAVKSFTSASGETIKHFFVAAATKKLQEDAGIKIKKKDAHQFLSEAEVDKILKPHLIKLVKGINNKTIKTYSKKEFFKKLKDS